MFFHLSPVSLSSACLPCRIWIRIWCSITEPCMGVPVSSGRSAAGAQPQRGVSSMKDWRKWSLYNNKPDILKWTVNLIWNLCRLSQTASWLCGGLSMMEEIVQPLSDPVEIKDVLQHFKTKRLHARNNEQSQRVISESEFYWCFCTIFVCMGWITKRQWDI